MSINAFVNYPQRKLHPVTSGKTVRYCLLSSFPSSLLKKIYAWQYYCIRLDFNRRLETKRFYKDGML